ncbi:hypothetical protein FMO003_13200 [Moritella sp. F3]|nr:hypothetical protein FMO001_15800 [Moritella sp. F1]GIC81039.1 hypothetical protein FMO003_13200 [Moritella sp. F3]
MGNAVVNKLIVSTIIIIKVTKSAKLKQLNNIDIRLKYFSWGKVFIFSIGIYCRIK